MIDAQSLTDPQLWAQLGTGAIFLGLYISERTTTKKMTVELLDAYKENTRVTEGVKAVMAEIKETTQQLNERTYEVLLESRKKK